MARQSSTPVQFQRSTRNENRQGMSSGFAGKTQLVSYGHLLRGESASGRVGIDVNLAEMPRPLLNAVTLNVQAWFVPTSAHPRFSGYDEFMNSYHGEQIRALNQPDRDPPPFFDTVAASNVASSELFVGMGLHLAVPTINTEMIDAFVLVNNFRRAAHSTRIPLWPYASEDIAAATSYPPAFWPSGKRAHMVPDYERALVVGDLGFDIQSGIVPVRNLYGGPSDAMTSSTPFKINNSDPAISNDQARGLFYNRDAGDPRVYADMANIRVNTTLADLDKARTTQTFAKLRAAYAGNDPTGYVNDDVIVAELMQGFSVPSEMFSRPWLLDQTTVPFGMVERHASYGPNLDASVSQGGASATLSINVPRQETGGTIIVLIEVLPERLDEAQHDEALAITNVSELPDALRDVQRIEPVDIVKARRIDARHTNPDAAYGFEPMNKVWDRDFTFLGGSFYQPDPSEPFSEQRSAIWQVNVVDPLFTDDHWIVPDDFPQDVFAIPTQPAYELTVNQRIAVSGLTQFGDVLSENQDDYDAVTSENDQ